MPESGYYTICCTMISEKRKWRRSGWEHASVCQTARVPDGRWQDSKKKKGQSCLAFQLPCWMFTRYETVDGPKCSSSSRPASSAEAMSQTSFDVGWKRRGMRRSGEVGWSGRGRWGWIDCSCFGLTTATADTARANNNSSLYFCTTALIQPPPHACHLPQPASCWDGRPPACLQSECTQRCRHTYTH